jgi:hypothetical protein
MRPITAEDFDKVKLKSFTSAGDSGIPAEVARRLTPKTKKAYILIFNFCMSHKILPSAWNTARITLLGKGTHVAERPDGYRPISVLNSMYKIYTTILHSRLMEHINLNNILSPAQAGYRKGMSTASDVITLINILEDRKENPSNKSAYMAFIDIQKAFDSIPHWAIFKTLEHME